MKFESKFGIGEIVTIDDADWDRVHSKTGEPNERKLRTASDFGKIVQIRFDGSRTEYIVEQVTPGGNVIVRDISEHRMNNDPDFDQEKGYYPPELIQP